MRTTARSKNLFYNSYYEVKQIMPATGWQMLIGEPTVYIGDDGEEEDGGMDYRLSLVYALALARIEPPEDPSEWDCPRYHIYKHLYDENGSLAGISSAWFIAPTVAGVLPTDTRISSALCLQT